MDAGRTEYFSRGEFRAARCGIELCRDLRGGSPIGTIEVDSSRFPLEARAAQITSPEPLLVQLGFEATGPPDWSTYPMKCPGTR